tara:strand:+ start:50 stop:775 length:726 start_codon:yes stop_codon:yes gene_type:complete
MVNIDTVYQRVLILANKEQRGYITPQEFNLYANQAQMEIFEQYFYDLNQAHRDLGNDTTYADVDDMLDEKLQIFESEDDATSYTNLSTNFGGGKVLPDDIYRVIRIEANNKDCDILSTKDFKDIQNAGYLIRPTSARPVANIRSNIVNDIRVRVVRVLPSHHSVTSVCYYKKPRKVSWGYFVLNTQALYDSALAVDFELHPSEETELVYKILKLAGLGMRRDDIAKGGQGLESMQVQQEKQ